MRNFKNSSINYIHIRDRIKQELINWLFTISIVLLLSVTLTRFIILNAYVPTSSMENTISSHDRVIANRLYYKFKEIKRGDIIVFKYPDDEKDLYVKRVIALPGELIESVKGKIYINGEYLEEEYVFNSMHDNFGPYEVPEEQYFVMGDNRKQSNDSRFWQNTCVKKENIIGKIFLRYYPNFTLF